MYRELNDYELLYLVCDYDNDFEIIILKYKPLINKIICKYKNITKYDIKFTKKIYMEENEFIEILNGSDIDFITVVIRDNNLNVRVLNRETTVKENLTKLSGNLHKNGKKMVLEYTFRFFDEFFKTFVRAIQEDCKDMNLDGIKLDLADCSVEDIGKIIKDLTSIRESLPNLNISLQVSNKVWEKYSSSFEELNITRTVSSKEELLIGEHDLSADTDVNYEISIYKNQQEYEQKVFSLSNQRDRLLDKDPEDVSYALRPLLELGEEKFADQIIDNRLEAIFQKVVLNDSIGKLILPVNMLYAKRLEDNENSNVIQAVSNLIRLFKESKGMNERRLFAYEYGLQQNIVLTDEQEKEIAEILRGESKSSAGNYVRKNFPYVFDYFVESRQTRIEISDSFLFGIYEANIIRKYKEGYFGKVLEFVVDSNVSFDTQERVDTRQSLFYKALAQIYLYKDAENIQDIFSLNDNEYKYNAYINQLNDGWNDNIVALQEEWNEENTEFIKKYSQDIKRVNKDKDLAKKIKRQKSLKEIREMKNIKQSTIAKELGISNKTYMKTNSTDIKAFFDIYHKVRLIV